MWVYTSNFIKLDMKGYYAFNDKPPGRSKIRKKKHNLDTLGGIKFIWTSSSPPPLPPQPVAKPAKVSRPLQQK
jgi:hypothetical protein